MTQVSGWQPRTQQAPSQGWQAPKAKSNEDQVKIACVLEFTRDLHTPNDKTGKFQLNMTRISEPGAERLGQLGLETFQSLNKPELGNRLTPKSRDYPFKAFLADGSEVDIKKVGSGTKAEVTISTYKNTYGTFPNAKYVKITELVEYVAEERTDGDEEVF